MNKTMLLTAVAAIAAVDLMAAPRFDRTKFNIGTYHLAKAAHADANIKDVKDCGIDFVIGTMDRPTLDLFAKYGIGAFQENVMPWWWGGGDPKRNGNMRTINTFDKYEKAAKGFVDHPAICAIDSGDEPSAMDFPYYGEVIRHGMENYPNQLIYLNLYPNYAAAASLTRSQAQSQLGTASYREHLMEYCKHIPLDFICFDCYAWGWGNTPQVLVENLRQVSLASLGSRKDMWVVVQANTHIEGKFNNRKMTEETMEWQASVAMAYGARVISWACWGDGGGWWALNPVSSNGTKTATYYMLQKVNRRLHKTGERFMKYLPVGTDLVGFDPAAWPKVRQQSLKAASDSAFSGLAAEDGAVLAVGHLVAVNGSGDRAVFVSACDDPNGEKIVDHRIVFSAQKGLKVSAWGGEGAVQVETLADGRYAVPLKTCRGVLIEACNE